MSPLLNFLAATGEARLRNLLIILKISFGWLAFLRGIFPSEGRTVISSTGFFGGFGPVIATAAAATPYLYIGRKLNLKKTQLEKTP